MQRMQLLSGNSIQGQGSETSRLRGAVGVFLFALVLSASACRGGATAADSSDYGLGSARALAAGEPIVERKVASMGTLATLRVWGQDRAAALVSSEAALCALEETEARLSTWREDTELAQFNRLPVGQTLELSGATTLELGRAVELARRTQRAFDPGIGALIDAWDLRGSGRVADADLVDELLKCGGLDQLLLQGNSVSRRNEHLRLEEGGFGKGAGLELALVALANSGAGRASIDMGGQLALLSDGRPFLLSVADPRARQRLVLNLVLDSGSLATTGNSERLRDVDGQAIGHILDPRSGYPAHLESRGGNPRWAQSSASVWCQAALDADALATAFFVMGPEEGLALAEQMPGVEAVFLVPVDSTRTNSPLDAHATSGLRGRTRALSAAIRLHFKEVQQQ
ncbi:MAG: thiamine biosynthesis lipoprotein [Planctomycetota bacterium]|jgi:thiamine biosynthesis lipoprotein